MTQPGVQASLNMSLAPPPSEQGGQPGGHATPADSQANHVITSLQDSDNLIWHPATAKYTGNHSNGKRFKVDIVCFVDAQGNGQAVEISMRFSFDLDLWMVPPDDALFAIGTLPDASIPARTTDGILSLWTTEDNTPQIVASYSLFDLMLQSYSAAKQDQDGRWTSTLQPIFDILVKDGFFTPDVVDATYAAVHEEMLLRRDERTLPRSDKDALREFRAIKRRQRGLIAPPQAPPPPPPPRHRVVYVRNSDDKDMEWYEEEMGDDDEDDAAMDEGPLRTCPRIRLGENVAAPPAVPAWPISGVSPLARKLDVITLVVAAKLSYIVDNLVDSLWCTAERSLRYFPSRNEVEYIADRLFTRVRTQGEDIPPERLRRSVFELLLSDAERASEEGLYLDDHRGPRKDEMQAYQHVVRSNLRRPVPPGRSKFHNGEEVRVFIRKTFNTTDLDFSRTFPVERYRPCYPWPPAMAIAEAEGPQGS